MLGRSRLSGDRHAARYAPTIIYLAHPRYTYIHVRLLAGTSDEHISVTQYLGSFNPDGAVIVTTPQVRLELVARCSSANSLPYALSSPGRVVVGRAKGNQLLQEDRTACAGRCGEHERLRLSVLPGSTFSSFLWVASLAFPTSLLTFYRALGGDKHLLHRWRRGHGQRHGGTRLSP